jgi:TolA-binding protein
MIANYFDIITSIRFQLTFSLLLFTFSAVTVARPLETQADEWTNSRSMESDSSGLIYTLPVINPHELQSEVNTLSLQLQQRQEDLSKFIQENRFSATDAVIVAALPGGLLYAAFKKQKSMHAEKELSGVRSQIDTLNQYVSLRDDSRDSQILAAR